MKKFKDFCRKSAAGLREAFNETPGRVVAALAALVLMLAMIVVLITAIVQMVRIDREIDELGTMKLDEPGTMRTEPRTAFVFPDEDETAETNDTGRILQDDGPSLTESFPDEEETAETDTECIPRDDEPWLTESFPDAETEGQAYAETEDAAGGYEYMPDPEPMSLPYLYQSTFDALRDVQSYKDPEIRQWLLGLATALALLLIAAVLALLTVVLLLKNCGSHSRVKVRRTLPAEEPVTSTPGNDPLHVLRNGGSVAVYGGTEFLRQVADLAITELGDGAKGRIRYFNPTSPGESSPLTVFSGKTVLSYRDAWVTAKTLFNSLHPAIGASERNEFFRQAGANYAAEVIWNLARRDNAQDYGPQARICILTGLAVTLSLPACWEDYMMYFEAHREPGRRALRASHLESLQNARMLDQMAAELSEAPVVFSRFTDEQSGRMYLGTEPYPAGTLMLVDTGGCCFEVERPVIEAALSGIASRNRTPFTVADNAVLERKIREKHISGWKYNFLQELISANIDKWNEDRPSVAKTAQAEYEACIRKVDEKGLALLETPDQERDADWRENSLVRDFPRYGYIGSRSVEPRDKPTITMKVTAPENEELNDLPDGYDGLNDYDDLSTIMTPLDNPVTQQ